MLQQHKILIPNAYDGQRFQLPHDLENGKCQRVVRHNMNMVDVKVIVGDDIEKDLLHISCLTVYSTISSCTCK
jgi:hypothetical protein